MARTPTKATGDPRKINPDTGLPFERLPDGSSNIEYFREYYASVTRDAHKCMVNATEPTVNHKQMTEMILKQAELCGHSQTDVVDSRSEEDILRDGIAKILETPEGFFEQTDEILDHLETEADKAVKRCQAIIDEKDANSEDPRILRALDLAAEKLEQGKSLLSRIRRVVRLRDMARNPVPTFVNKKTMTGRERAGWESSHLLRYTLYVARANNVLKSSDSPATQKLIRFGTIHAEMGVTLWMAVNGVDFLMDGIHWGARKYAGAIINAPPKHGKSEMAMNFASLWYCQKPDTQAAYLHEGEDVAKKSLAYIKSSFDPTTDRGRRNLALFPNVRLARRGNDAKQMKILTRNVTKSPSMIAAGVTSGRQGVNTTLQIHDDVVPQQDAHEDQTRKRRKEVIAGTWEQRQRGDAAFTLKIGTLWHVDDALAVEVKRALKGESQYALCQVKTGGPNTKPHPFKSAWPEVYGSDYLRNEYTKIASPTIWSAAYMGNPKADETRIVQRVRLYDRTLEEHRNFVASCVKHVTVDPAATNREKCDKVGVLYAGIGEVESYGQDEAGHETVTGVTKLRFLAGKELHNNPADLMQTLEYFCTSHPVDHVHIETKTGFAAVADWANERMGIECIRHDPGMLSKEKRLRQCAGMICTKINDVGGFEAVVEFPGVPRKDRDGNAVVKDGKVVLDPDPDIEWLIDQITEFGNIAGDHGLDAATQLINWASRNGLLPASGGLVTNQIRKTAEEAHDPRISQMFKMGTRKPVGTVEDRLVAFHAGPSEGDFRWN